MRKLGLVKRKKMDITGEKYGLLTVTKMLYVEGELTRCICSCDCGGSKKVLLSNLRFGSVKSCGCLVSEAQKKHGQFGTPTYSAWSSMKSRCLNKKSKKWKDYGGRGIKVCKRWLKFENFLADMGERPDNLQLDRINNNGNYTPKNCKWSTSKENCRNRRNNHLITYQGQTKTLFEWAEFLNMPKWALQYRIRKWDSVEKAFKEPLKKDSRRVQSERVRLEEQES